MSLRYSSHRAELAALLPSPHGLLAVDVGCGDGGMTRHLAAMGARAVGVEVDDRQLVRARAVTPAAGESYRVGRAEALPFADGEVGALLYFNSLHHVPEAAMALALAEAARVLAPKGLLVVVEPLAEGLYFETLRPLEDETGIRAAALAALGAAPPELSAGAESFYLNTVRFRDVAQFLAAIVAPDPARVARLPAVEGELRRRFTTHGRVTAGGVEFDQPMRLNTFSRR